MRSTGHVGPAVTEPEMWIWDGELPSGAALFAEHAVKAAKAVNPLTKAAFCMNRAMQFPAPIVCATSSVCWITV